MTTLRAHQQAMVAFALPKPASLLSGGMGTGKTFTAIHLAEAWDAKRTLVLCPTSVRDVWRREVALHATRTMDAVVLDRGSIARRTRQAEEAWGLSWPTMTVLNYEAAWREPMRSWILSRPWDLVVLDESQRAQRVSHTARFCALLHHAAPHRLALSGTPLTNDPISVWAQCRFLDPAVFGNDLDAFKIRFENRYAVGARKAIAKLNQAWFALGYKEPWVWPEEDLRGTINTEEYLQRLSTLAIRVESDVLDLPPLTVQRRTFRLNYWANRLYRTIKYGFDEEIETGRWAVPRSSYAVTMKLQQITSGWLFDKDREVQRVDTGKEDLLREILTEAAGETVVVFCRFRADLDIASQIAAELNLRYGEISGRRKDGVDNMARMRQGLEVVGVQEQSGGLGIDLSAARLAVDYSPGWALPIYEQKVCRLHRPPQEKPVTVYQLTAEGTVDEEIHRALDARRGIIKQVWREMETTTATE